MIRHQLFKLPILVLVIAIPLVIAACGGSAEGAHAGDAEPPTSTVIPDSAAHDDSSHDHDSGSTQLREWAGSPVPTVELSVDDSMDHTMLVIKADGFTFTSAAVTEPVDGEGHAHLYVDGKLLTMIYAPEFRLPDDVVSEDHVLTVTLSTNDHLEYAEDGEPVGETIMVGMQDGDSHADESAAEHHTPPVVPGDSVIETLHGVVIDIDGDLTMTHSFTILTDIGNEVILYPTAEAPYPRPHCVRRCRQR